MLFDDLLARRSQVNQATAEKLRFSDHEVYVVSQRLSCSSEAFRLGRHCARALTQDRGGQGLLKRYDHALYKLAVHLNPYWSHMISCGYYFQCGLDIERNEFLGKIHDAMKQLVASTETASIRLNFMGEESRNGNSRSE